jgi:hypothetical protein
MAKEKQPILLEYFPISAKTKNALIKAGIKNSDDFANFTLLQLDEIEGLGPVLLLELKTFLKGAKIKWKKREAKEKKAPKWNPETKEIMLRVLDGQVSNYAIEYQKCGMLIEKYGAETIRNSRIPDKVQPPTFRYFFTGGMIASWCDNYFKQFAPIRLLEAPRIDLEEAGGVEEVLELAIAPVVVYEPKKKAPSSLADFLKLRR